MLAAGVGERLGDAGQKPPKVLLEFAGETLLARHIAILRHAGVAELVLCTGYRAEDIEAAIAACRARDFVRTIHNADFSEGSMVSLWCVREALAAGGDVLLMDADVLYDHRLITSLIESRNANCFLMDRDIEPGEEPVKICIKDGRIVDFEKKVEHDYDYLGESVGFFRFSQAIGHRLGTAAGDYISAGEREHWYERAIRDLLLESPDEFGFEDVTGLPWLEIDYPEDVARAAAEILPRLEALPA